MTRPVHHAAPADHRCLCEYADSRGQSLAVDAGQGVIRGVKVLGLESTNGRSYLQSALAMALPLYEGAKVNVDHPGQGGAGPRHYRDRIGVLRGARLEKEGLFADLHFNPHHALAGQLAWDALHAPALVGLSHNVQARTSRRGGRTIVEAITQVHSVDLVADPATTRGLFEQSEPLEKETSEMPTDPMTVEELKARHPDLVEALRAEHRGEADIQESAAELARLRQELDRYRAAEALTNRRARVEELLVESRLPAAALSPTFIEQLLAVDEAECARLIADRRALVEGIAQRDLGDRPRSREQPPAGGQPAPLPTDARSFAAALH